MTQKLDRLNNQTRVTNPDGSPTDYFKNLHQRTVEKIEAIQALGDIEDLAGGASTADVADKVNEILAAIRSII